MTRKKATSKKYGYDAAAYNALPSQLLDGFLAGLLPSVPVTLLPGSRALTPESFALQVDALRALPDALLPDAFLAVAGGVNVDELARVAGLVHRPDALRHRRRRDDGDPRPGRR